MVTDSLRRILNTRQSDGKALFDYVKRVKQTKKRDVINSQVYSNLLDTFVENTLEYKKAQLAQKDDVKKEALNVWMEYLLIKNSDMKKYGSVLNGITLQYSMANNQFPKNIQKAMQIKQTTTTINMMKIIQTIGILKGSNKASFCKKTKRNEMLLLWKIGHFSSICSEKDTRPKSQQAI